MISYYLWYSRLKSFELKSNGYGNNAIMHSITLRKSTQDDRDFVDGLTRRTMSRYVTATWSKTEEIEHYYALNAFKPSNTRIIQYDGEDVGRITVSYSNTRITLEGIHIVEAFQGKGIGGHLIRQIIRESDEKALLIQLILLKTNPARQLYERIGFFVYEEDENRYYMRMAV